VTIKMPQPAGQPAPVARAASTEARYRLYVDESGDHTRTDPVDPGNAFGQRMMDVVAKKFYGESPLFNGFGKVLLE